MPQPFGLGRDMKFDSSIVFATQATATCLFLMYAQGGRYRDRLIEFVGRYFRGEDVSPETCFGMSADELGRRALAFAATLRGK